MVVLLTPSVLQSIHAFHDHTHIVCSSMDEHHFHEGDVDCSLWHYHVEFYNYDQILSSEIVFNQLFEVLIPQPESVWILSNAKKSPRAPPALM